MIKINQAVIVEGKYDKIKLSRFIDAPIITTDGFAIFKDKERQQLLRTLAKSRGLVVLTDSDSAGFIIRSFIGNAVDKKYIINAYIPDIYGKEKRKTEPSKEGMLGVEGMTEQVITKALTDAGVFCEQSSVKQREITKLDLFEAGFSGCADSAARRSRLLEYFGLPRRLSSNGLVEVLNCITTKEGFLKAAEEINGRGE
ncbi:MAG: DUF4093 domain-containing protein [Clostridia bacterium]|nr:DUF4093 domain-containing protein [Clostridia bacterium]